MKCAVRNCKVLKVSRPGSPNQIYFFKFPKNERQLKLWVAFCKQNNINTSMDRVCSQHFKPEDFERNMQFELGFCKRNKLTLKEGVVPTVYVQTACNESIAKVDHVANYKPIIKALTNNTNKIDANDTEEMLQQQVQYLKEEIEEMRQSNRLLEETEAKTMHQIKSIENQIKQLDVINYNMEKSLGRIFTEGQIKKLKNGDKRQIWTYEDISRSMELYTTSVEVYNLLYRKNFPLPGTRTLQRRTAENK